MVQISFWQPVGGLIKCEGCGSCIAWPRKATLGSYNIWLISTRGMYKRDCTAYRTNWTLNNATIRDALKCPGRSVQYTTRLSYLAAIIKPSSDSKSTNILTLKIHIGKSKDMTTRTLAHPTLKRPKRRLKVAKANRNIPHIKAHGTSWNK